MKIRKIFFEVHPILQGLNLDFTDVNGKTLDTIILAGENGAGKSVILNTIFNFSRTSPDAQHSDEKISFEIELSERDVIVLTNGGRFSNPVQGDIYTLVIDYRIVNNWDRFKIYKHTDNGLISVESSAFSKNKDSSIIFSCVFSDVEINFSPQQIKGVTSLNIDQGDGESAKSSISLATQITQLLIDIQTLDALDFSEWAKNNMQSPIDDNKLDIRTKRFTNAFDKIFPTKKYKTIKTTNGTKQVVFEENGREMNISQLSSGEKQIVFRGGFLLQNLGSTQGAVVLVDEPEISLHPEWQLKILGFFKALFINAKGQQTSQLIVATHSPFVIHNHDRKEDKVIIIKKDINGLVMSLKDSVFYGWSPNRIVQEAFKVNHIYDDKKTVVFVEGETDELYFNKVLELLPGKYDNLSFKWIGRVNDKGNVEFTGDSALNQAKIFFQANPEQIKNKTVLLYDSDTNKPVETLGMLFTRKMSINSSNALFKIGVENLLKLPNDFDIRPFYKETKKIDNYGAESLIRELNKVSLCNHICNEFTKELSLQTLQNLDKQLEALVQTIT